MKISKYSIDTKCLNQYWFCLEYKNAWLSKYFNKQYSTSCIASNIQYQIIDTQRFTIKLCLLSSNVVWLHFAERFAKSNFPLYTLFRCNCIRYLAIFGASNNLFASKWCEKQLQKNLPFLAELDDRHRESDISYH